MSTTRATPLCACGCGEPIPLLTKNGNPRRVPSKFIFNHQGKRGPNKATHLSDGTTVITIEQKDGNELQCLLDTTDYPLVKDHRWSAFKGKDKRTFYVSTVIYPNGQRKTLLMHKLLIPNAEVDHKNHNGLDNRRSNLRSATGSQNAANRRRRLRKFSSRHKGVHRHYSKFRAAVTVNGKTKYLGVYASEKAAARAYDDAARKHFGRFAALNFPRRGEQIARKPDRWRRS